MNKYQIKNSLSKKIGKQKKPPLEVTVQKSELNLHYK